MSGPSPGSAKKTTQPGELSAGSITDGGGLVSTVLDPVSAADAVARFFVGIWASLRASPTSRYGTSGSTAGRALSPPAQGVFWPSSAWLLRAAGSIASRTARNP